MKSARLRLGVTAPPGVAIFRRELLESNPELRAAEIPAAPAEEIRRTEAFAELSRALRNKLGTARVGLALAQQQLRLQRYAGAEDSLTRVAQEIDAASDFLNSVDDPAPAASAKQSGAVRRVLVVEDDRNECELLAGFLRLAGLEVTTARDGVDALDRLRSGDQPDIILLDMMLPRCDGPTTLRQICQNPKLDQAKIYAVTGHAQSFFEQNESTERIDRWFRKPLDPERLLRELAGELAV